MQQLYYSVIDLVIEQIYFLELLKLIKMMCEVIKVFNVLYIKGKLYTSSRVLHLLVDFFTLMSMELY